MNPAPLENSKKNNKRCGMKYSSLSIAKYLDKLAEKTPVPGGGSAAAIFGAIGCALMEMVLNYSNRKSAVIKKSLVIFRNYRKHFLKLMDEDIKTYGRLSLRLKQHKKDARRVQAALQEATLTPFEIAGRSYKAMKLCSRLVNITNRNLASDIGCAVNSFYASFNAARFNIDINLKCVKDKKFVNSIRKNIISLNNKISSLKIGIIKTVNKNIG